MATTLDETYLRRTQLGLAAAHRDLHHYSLGAQHACLQEGGLPSGGHSSCARRLEFLTKRVKIMAILADRASGATWERIGELWSIDPAVAERHYAPMEAAWRGGDNAPWTPRVEGVTVTGLMPIEVDAATAPALSAYVWTQAPPRDRQVN